MLIYAKEDKMKPEVWGNISKTSARVTSGAPNAEKQMKARGCRPSAFIVSRCLEPLVKHEARVFDMTSQMKQYRFIQCHIFGMFL